ncbi:MAG TPA: hypothetical protein VMF58_06000 [Rhizomicrobium sp.]|nr:hypothetical protein [Rhizomicrobium sp.]
MIVRALLVLLGLANLGNGLFMLFAPDQWFAAVPGVPVPFNPHFVMDIGMAYIASGVGLALGARAGLVSAVLACAGAAWPVLHALIHIDGWMMHGFPTDMRVALSETVGVVGLATAGAVLALLRLKGEPR